MNLLNPALTTLATVALSFVPMALQRGGVEVVLGIREKKVRKVQPHPGSRRMGLIFYLDFFVVVPVRAG